MTEPKLKPCPWCDGKGKKYLQVFNETMECAYCNGTGKLQMTNDEQRRTCSTEEFAEFLFIIGEDNWLTDISNRDEIVPHEKDVVEWLKQPHKDK